MQKLPHLHITHFPFLPDSWQILSVDVHKQGSLWKPQFYKMKKSFHNIAALEDLRKHPFLLDFFFIHFLIFVLY